jgi:hypothetical protein
MVRKEIEKIDYFLGINMVFSLGGGTGKINFSIYLIYIKIKRTLNE